jgi:putative Mn2+ efflux pump MntP
MPVFAASLALLALAVSLDGFGVGVAYGLRRIRIPALSVAIIACCSAFAVALAMTVGHLLAGWLSPRTASAAGAVILFALGGWALWQSLHNRDSGGADADTPRNGAVAPLAGTLPGPAGAEAVLRPVPRVNLLTLEIRPLGIIIHILRTPSAADADRSGTISAGEAVWLGAALSLDAFGAGIGAALLGLPVVGTPVAVALSCAAFLWLGLGVGRKAGGHPWIRTMSILPGVIMMALGVLRLF